MTLAEAFLQRTVGGAGTAALGNHSPGSHTGASSRPGTTSQRAEGSAFAFDRALTPQMASHGTNHAEGMEKQALRRKAALVPSERSAIPLQYMASVPSKELGISDPAKALPPAWQLKAETMWQLNNEGDSIFEAFK